MKKMSRDQRKHFTKNTYIEAFLECVVIFCLYFDVAASFGLGIDTIYLCDAEGWTFIPHEKSEWLPLCRLCLIVLVAIPTRCFLQVMHIIPKKYNFF